MGRMHLMKRLLLDFLSIAKLNKLPGLPDNCSVPLGQERPQDGIHFIRIQLTGF